LVMAQVNPRSVDRIVSEDAKKIMAYYKANSREIYRYLQLVNKVSLELGQAYAAEQAVLNQRFYEDKLNIPVDQFYIWDLWSRFHQGWYMEDSWIYSRGSSRFRLKKKCPLGEKVCRIWDRHLPALQEFGEKFGYAQPDPDIKGVFVLFSNFVIKNKPKGLAHETRTLLRFFTDDEFRPKYIDYTPGVAYERNIVLYMPISREIDKRHYQAINTRIIEVLKHEYEHLYQGIPAKSVSSSNDYAAYLLQSNEVEAWVAGQYAKAKQKKVPIQRVFLQTITNLRLSDEERRLVKTAWEKELPRKHPRALEKSKEIIQAKLDKAWEKQIARAKKNPPKKAKKKMTRKKAKKNFSPPGGGRGGGDNRRLIDLIIESLSDIGVNAFSVTDIRGVHELQAHIGERGDGADHKRSIAKRVKQHLAPSFKYKAAMIFSMKKAGYLRIWIQPGAKATRDSLLAIVEDLDGTAFAEIQKHEIDPPKKAKKKMSRKKNPEFKDGDFITWESTFQHKPTVKKETRSLIITGKRREYYGDNLIEVYDPKTSGLYLDFVNEDMLKDILAEGGKLTVYKPDPKEFYTPAWMGVANDVFGKDLTPRNVTRLATRSPRYKARNTTIKSNPPKKAKKNPSWGPSYQFIAYDMKGDREEVIFETNDLAKAKRLFPQFSVPKWADLLELTTNHGNTLGTLFHSRIGGHHLIWRIGSGERIDEPILIQQQSNPPKKAKKKANKVPTAKELVAKCQKLWAAYCRKPGVTKLRAVDKHCEAMKTSKAKSVAAERSRCMRSVRAEAKSRGWKL